MKLKTVTPFTLKYWEFPELLFGKSETGIVYFDATFYIIQKGDPQKHSPVDFIRKFAHWFDSVKIAYEIPDNEVVITDEATGHVLIDESLALLFVAYVNPDFGVYILERVSEMLLDGVTLSDTRIMQIVRERLTKETLSNLIKEL